MASLYQLRGGLLLDFNGALSLNNFPIDNSADQLTAIMQMWQSDTLTHIGFRQGTITGTPGVLRCGIQGVDGSGNPDGTFKNSGNAFNDYTPVSGNNNTWQWLALGATYTPSALEHLALVAVPQSGTFDGSNLVNLSQFVGASITGQYPYTIGNNAGSPSREGRHILAGVKSASLAYGSPAQNLTTQAFMSTSTPDEYAIAFTVPSGMCSTYKVRGIKNLIIGQAAGQTTKIQLYSGTTVLQTFTWDSDVGTSASQRQAMFWLSDTLATLTAGQTYRIGIQPQTASNVTLSYMDVATASDWDAWPGGQLFWSSSRTNEGSWSDTLTRRFFGEVVFEDVTAPSGGGTFSPFRGPF